MFIIKSPNIREMPVDEQRKICKAVKAASRPYRRANPNCIAAKANVEKLTFLIRSATEDNENENKRNSKIIKRKNTRNSRCLW